MMFDGKVFAAIRREELLARRKKYGDVSLGVVVGGTDPVTSSFVRIKERTAHALNIRLVRYPIPLGADTDAACALLERALRETSVIVQLPLPAGIEVERLLAHIPKEKDADALSPAARLCLAAGDPSLIPPVAAAIRSILKKQGWAVFGKRVVVVGKGRLVGAPCAILLKHLGADVVVLDKNDPIASFTKEADMVVLGAGSPHLLKPEMIKNGVIIFDAGTSEQGGVVVGDATPTCAEKAAFFTPTPGGIGPVAVVELFANVLSSARV